MPPQHSKRNTVLLTIIILILHRVWDFVFQKDKLFLCKLESPATTENTTVQQEVSTESQESKVFIRSFKVRTQSLTTTYAKPPITSPQLTNILGSSEDLPGSIPQFENIRFKGDLIDYLVLNGVSFNVIPKPTIKTFYLIPGGGDARVASYDPTTKKWSNVEGVVNYTTEPILKQGTTVHGYTYATFGMADACWGASTFLIDVPNKNYWLTFDLDQDVVCDEAESGMIAFPYKEKLAQIFESLEFE
jgi:hypothetical protein